MIPAQVEKILDDQLPSASTVIIGVSGGSDSVYLLEHLRRISHQKKLRIIVAHVDHGLRGKESDSDADFVKKLTKKYGLIFEYTKIKINKGNLEEMGRKKRYDFFEKLRKKYRATWILTAHHQDDNIETALFNLIRGASFQGIQGMQMKTTSRHLFRPLLSTSKKEISAFLKKEKIPFRKDSSNDNINFSRNFLRHKVIPLLKKINPNFEETFGENLKNFTEIANFLEEKTEMWLKKNFKNNAFILENFLEKPGFFQKNILVNLYKKTYGSTNKLTQYQLNEIIDVLRLKKANRKKEFGSDFFAEVLRPKEGGPHVVKLLSKQTSQKSSLNPQKGLKKAKN